MVKLGYKKIIGHITSWFKPSSFNLFEAPRRDWKYILWGVLLWNIGSVVFAGYIFWRINRGDIFKANQTIPVSVAIINRNQLQDVVSAYDEKNQTYKTLLGERPQVVDPAK